MKQSESVKRWKIELQEFVQKSSEELAALQKDAKRLLSEWSRTKTMDSFRLYLKTKDNAEDLERKICRTKVELLDQVYVSKYLYSDVEAYEVVNMKTPDLWEVRELDCELTEEASRKLKESFVPGGFFGHFDNSLQEWRFTSNKDNPVITIRRHKDGNFYMPNNSCKFVPKASPYKRYDYNF